MRGRCHGRRRRSPPSAIDRRNRRLGLDLLEEARRFYAGYAGDAERDAAKSLDLFTLCHALYNLNEFVYVD